MGDNDPIKPPLKINGIQNEITNRQTDTKENINNINSLESPIFTRLSLYVKKIIFDEYSASASCKATHMQNTNAERYGYGDDITSANPITLDDIVTSFILLYLSINAF